jgi:hypothetical protein
MADRFYGVAIGGQQPVSVTESSSTTSAAVELRISDTAYSQPLLAQLALEAIKNYLQTKETHPIA